MEVVAASIGLQTQSGLGEHPADLAKEIPGRETLQADDFKLTALPSVPREAQTVAGYSFGSARTGDDTRPAPLVILPARDKTIFCRELIASNRRAIV
jgi:hypothetical protein